MTFTAVDSTALPPSPEVQVNSTVTGDGTLYVTTLLDSGGKPVAVAANFAGGTAGVFSSITGSDSSLDIVGQPTAQGGAIVVQGGTSSTAANAGGAATLKGGTPGATGIGGGAAVTGGAGLGGAAGGTAVVTGGAGQGIGAGAQARLIGGASGAGATGTGGATLVTGGASLATDGAGGNVTIASGASVGSGAGASITLTPGAVGTGAAGGVFQRGLNIIKQGTPTALTGAATLTAAQVLTQILVSTTNAGAGVAYQMPTGTDLQLALPADLSADDAFDFSLINASTNAADIITITVNTDVTLIGAVTIQANNAATTSPVGRFRARKTGNHVFVVYRLS